MRLTSLSAVLVLATAALAAPIVGVPAERDGAIAITDKRYYDPNGGGPDYAPEEPEKRTYYNPGGGGPDYSTEEKRNYYNPNGGGPDYGAKEKRNYYNQHGGPSGPDY